VSKGTNKNITARSTLVQVLAAYTNPESHNAQRHRQTDGQQAAANSRSYCVAVRSAKNADFHNLVVTASSRLMEC